MPIHCPPNIEPVSTELFRSLDYAVMGHIYASQNSLGRLADEQVYRSDVAHRLNAAGMQSDEEVPIQLTRQAFA